MFYYDTSLEFDSADLLSYRKAMQLLKAKDREYEDCWWLSTPGSDETHVCRVYESGNINVCGGFVRNAYSVRPALNISNLGNFQVGNTFSIGEWKFKIISPSLAWLYEQDIGVLSFGDDNKYKTSVVKFLIDKWYESLTEEMK